MLLPSKPNFWDGTQFIGTSIHPEALTFQNSFPVCPLRVTPLLVAGIIRRRKRRHETNSKYGIVFQISFLIQKCGRTILSSCPYPCLVGFYLLSPDVEPTPRIKAQELWRLIINYRQMKIGSQWCKPQKDPAELQLFQGYPEHFPEPKTSLSCRGRNLRATSACECFCRKLGFSLY